MSQITTFFDNKIIAFLAEKTSFFLWMLIGVVVIIVSVADLGVCDTPLGKGCLMVGVCICLCSLVSFLFSFRKKRK